MYCIILHVSLSPGLHACARYSFPLVGSPQGQMTLTGVKLLTFCSKGHNGITMSVFTVICYLHNLV